MPPSQIECSQKEFSLLQVYFLLLELVVCIVPSVQILIQFIILSQQYFGFLNFVLIEVCFFLKFVCHDSPLNAIRYYLMLRNSEDLHVIYVSLFPTVLLGSNSVLHVGLRVSCT